MSLTASWSARFNLSASSKDTTRLSAFVDPVSFSRAGLVFETVQPPNVNVLSLRSVFAIRVLNFLVGIIQRKCP